jgi:hypothetical protein
MSPSELFLDADWAKCQSLPSWAKKFLDEYPVACCQAAEWLDFEPPALTEPSTIEVYINGDDQPSLVWSAGQVVLGNFERLCDEYTAIVFEVDAVVRYAEIEGRDLIDTTAGILWPDCICSPAAQVMMLASLARK